MTTDTETPKKESVQEPPEQQTPQFPLVGIGASAGGLEAISALLSSLAANSGVALLVVQHLDRDHPSMLTEILARRTTMPVIEATAQQVIERDHVYVIPPNTSMTVTRGRLTLKSRDTIPGIPTPIDDLFHSLAEDQGTNAIGISLSGSGSDGALGLQAIKGEGGITFAQDDATAKFNSMPRAAVDLGCVDFVMAPEEIAEELMRIGQNPATARQPAPLDVEQIATDEANLGKIFQKLNQACNHDFSHYKRGTLTRRLSRRIALLNLNSLEDYIRFVKTNPNELQALYQDLLIRVTSFFRDPEAFEGLSRKVFPALMEKHASGEAIRIWVPGCSTGEEVYSIAIYLMEYLNERAASTKIQIFGTDVSESALASARAGIYFESIANGVSEERLKRFFTKRKGHYQVAKGLRNLCVFANQNVTCDPPFSQLDLISCRNVLIYFDPVLQKRVISLFHYALRPGGSLMLGPSETIGQCSDIFAPVHDKKFNIFVKRAAPPRSHLQYLNRNNTAKPVNKQTHKPPVPVTPDKQQRDIDRIALARYVPAGVLCDDDLNIVEFRGDTSPYLVQPSGFPSTNLRQLARLGLFVEISNMIDQARKTLQPVRRVAQRVEMRDGIREVDLEVIPVQQKNIDGTLFLLFFEKPTFEDSKKREQSASLWTRLQSVLPGHGRGNKHEGRTMQQLQEELDATRQHIRTMTDEHNTAQEDLKASQEELLSSNEEFQSTNEELETAKEELQSANEELLTTNDELLHRNDDLHTLNAQLEQSRNYADAIVETVREPLVILDENLRIVRTNAAFYSTFKLTPGQTVGCLFYELDDKQWDIPALRQVMSEILPTDTSVHNFELTNNFRDIGQRTMVLNGRQLAWNSQTLILLAIEDITDYKAAQDELKDTNQRKDEFLAMLAHELRNPLAPIRNALEIWQRGDAGPEAEQMAQIIMDRQLRKESRLIDDLLDIARISRGSIVLVTEPVDLRQIATQAVDDTRHQYQASNLHLELELPEDEVIVEGDAVRMEQIISNLLNNAAKYSRPGGRIVLKLEAVKTQSVLRVIDDGIGISDDLLPHIFDLFVQAKVSSDRAKGGLGIGLTLVRRLVELHAGTIEARSGGVNRGSEFILRLPIATGARLAEIDTAAEAVTTLHRRVLVVDDNIDSANTSALLLQLEGHDAKAVYDGQSALDVAASFRPEIVLLDIGLPDMDGYQVAQHLRETPQLSDALLVAVSGYGHTERQAHARGVRFDDYFMKPVEMNQLRSLFAQFDARESAKDNTDN